VWDAESIASLASPHENNQKNATEKLTGKSEEVVSLA